MSTRSTAHFVSDDGSTRAIVYRHQDGYPDGAGRDILEFLNTVKKNSPNDTRFTDPEYLAARYVAFLSDKFSVAGYLDDMGVWREKALPPYSFISVGVCMEDPGDIEYRYLIHCSADKNPNDEPTANIDVAFVEIYTGIKYDLRKYLSAMEVTV
jgi:hypothetical protein